MHTTEKKINTREMSQREKWNVERRIICNFGQTVKKIYVRQNRLEM